MLKSVQRAIYNLFKKEPFYALLVQEINIRMRNDIPTMGVSFDKKVNKFYMYINEKFFDSMTDTEREATIIHELLHVLHKHILDVRMIETENKAMLNIAMDMAINQYIKGLPKSCVDVKTWKQKDGTPFPKFKNFETYYKLIDDTKDNQNKDEYSKYVQNEGQSLDVHDFEALSEDEKKEMLKEMKGALERTIEKTVYGHTSIPDFIKDILKDINANIGALNYKKILMNTIKKTLSLADREHTWSKPNRRYGYMSKGTKVGAIPNACFLADTSGSISHKELNEFMSVIDNFLKVGQKKCFLGLWHTDLYSVKKYRVGTRVKAEDLQSGGTDVNSALQFVKKKNFDLTVILTDCFFDLPKEKYTQNILWVVAKNGNTDKTFLDRLPGKYVFIP